MAVLILAKHDNATLNDATAKAVTAARAMGGGTDLLSSTVAVDATNRYVVLANGPGVAAFPINKDGSLAPRSDLFIPPGEPGPCARVQRNVSGGGAPPRGADASRSAHECASRARRPV